VCGLWGYGANIVTLSEETESNREHKPAPNDPKAHIYSTNDIQGNVERWDFIEEYFLGYDVMANESIQDINLQNANQIEMLRSIDTDHSHQINSNDSWKDLNAFFDANDQIIINRMVSLGIKKPEYLETAIKKTDAGNDILMSWPSDNVLICQQEASDNVIGFFRSRGWHVYRIQEIDFDNLKVVLS
jgi:hypothetical protein